jgi:uracil-DNA glycosylase
MNIKIIRNIIVQIKMNILYHESWQPLFDEYSFKDIEQLYSSSDEIYPEKDNIFKVFEMDIREIKILLLGQDPYHGPGQAHGLSFSVPESVKTPPSLRNIYKELQNEFPERDYKFNSGNLNNWFYREKIFLLNASLSVIKGKPGSHMNIWKDFTNDVIKFICDRNSKCIFILLGNFAKEKESLIFDKERIIKGVHPSPLSAHNGFFGSNIFKRVEELLNQQIDWSV